MQTAFEHAVWTVGFSPLVEKSVLTALKGLCNMVQDLPVLTARSSAKQIRCPLQAFCNVHERF